MTLVKLSFYLVMIIFNICGCYCYSLPVSSIEESCCNVPEIMEIQYFKSCNDEINAKDHYYLTNFAKAACEAECGFISANFLHGKSTFLNNKFHEFIEKKFQNTSDDIWISVFMENFKSCTEMAVSNKSELFALATEYPYNLLKLNCNPLPYYVFSCLQTLNYKHCPIQIWKSSDYCTTLRESR